MMEGIHKNVASAIVILLALGSSGYAQSAKLPPPFKVPFLISIQVNGLAADSTWFLSTPDGPAKLTAESFIDSVTIRDSDHITYAHLKNGVDSIYIEFSQGSYGGSRGFGSIGGRVMVTFDSANGTISEFDYLTRWETAAQYQDGGTLDGSDNIVLRNMKFDTTGIYFSDSAYSNHVTIASEVWLNDDLRFFEEHWTYSISSIDLSGIFHPTRLTNTASVSSSSVSSGLSFRSIRGVLDCTFEPSLHPRILEVFSPLGVTVGAHPVSQGETSAMLPRLPAGLYFIRIEGEMLKVFVPE